MASSGTIEKRGTGTYRLEISDGVDNNGKRIKYRKTIKAKNDGEARKALALFVAEIEKGQYVDCKQFTVNDLITKWLKTYSSSLAPKTLWRYKIMLDNRIQPQLGHIKLRNLKPLHLIDFYNHLQANGARFDGKEEGLSAKTILHHHRLLSVIFRNGVEWGLLPFNPCDKVKPPKVQRKEASHYDQDEVRQLFQMLESEPLKYKAIVVLTIASGLRRGEIMGLTWSDINLVEKTINVRQTSQYISGLGTFTKAPKNTTSKRMISISDFAVKVLLEYKENQEKNKEVLGNKWNESGMVFTQDTGEPMHPDTISQWFPQFIRRHNLPPLTFHQLRHTNATLLIASGMDIRSVSARLGHANTSTTLNIYAHVLKSADKEAADKLDNMFSS